ncbi:conserved hypothetical protein [Desulfonatronospira thiodismutans ASO3-1]|uniref:DUF1640 domain-containing protein n=1 Tax=Desulfonatronospira thiodismutans ASO3-1 TaxID=555779 RepID=D6SU51_9BACT|nr:hypothetical protein [Desulfonatronospira thiodismutans]EFI32831.1 conserved hypothetical protein [Desulfonatronospira thiodismutans ASO3-1]
MTQPASVIDLYDSLLAAEDERARARIIAGAFERLEDRYPELKDLATASGVRESELRLQKEIEQLRLRIEEVRSDLTREIEQVRADLSKDIERLRAETSKEIAAGNQKILRWTTGLLFAQLVAIIAVIFGVALM